MFFLCDFFKLVFSNPRQFLQETKRFASVKDSSTFSALCDLLETFKKVFRIFFPQFSVFLKVFRWERCFFAVSGWEKNRFSILMRISSGIFWSCKIDQILKLSFYPWLSVRYCLFGFLLKSSKLSSQVTRCLRSTASPLCYIWCRKFSWLVLFKFEPDTSTICPVILLFPLTMLK